MRKSRSGNTLVMILVSAVIGGLVMMGMLSMMRNLSRGTHVAAQAANQSVIRSQVVSILSNPQACKDSFTGVTFGTTQTIQLKRGTEVLLNVNQQLEGLRISAISAQVSALDAANSAFVTLTVETTKLGNKVGQLTKQDKFFVTLLANAGVVSSCMINEDPRVFKLVELERQNLGCNGAGCAGFTYTTTQTNVALDNYSFIAKGNKLKLNIHNIRAFGKSVVGQSSFQLTNLSTGAAVHGAVQCSSINTSTVDTPHTQAVEHCQYGNLYDTVVDQSYRLTLLGSSNIPAGCVAWGVNACRTVIQSHVVVLEQYVR